MLKPLSEVTKRDITNANRIEAVTQAEDGEDDLDFPRQDSRHDQAAGQSYARGNTLVVKLRSDEELPKLKDMISQEVGRDIAKDD